MRPRGCGERCTLQIAALLARACLDKDIDQSAQAFRLCLQILAMREIYLVGDLRACRRSLVILSAEMMHASRRTRHWQHSVPVLGILEQLE